MNMKNKFKTPNISCQNVMSFTCSDDAVMKLLELLDELRRLGSIGSSRKLTIDWDGDGSDRLENITINGMTLKAWDDEHQRLRENEVFHKNNTDGQQEENESN